MSIQENTITVDGKAVHYWRSGQGNAREVVLLHGGFGDAWANWSEILPALGQSFDVIAPDLPGWGQSGPLSRRSLQGLSAWVIAVMDALKLEQAALVGHSFGGLAVRLAAAAYPARVPALILIDGGVIPVVPGSARLAARTPGIGRLLFRQIVRGTTARRVVARAFHNDEALTDSLYNSITSNREALAALMRLMTTSAAPKARQPLSPVLLLWGENDPITPLRTAERIQEEIPGAQLSRIADCGHMPHIEAPEVFTAQLEHWLSNFDRKPGSVRGPGELKMGSNPLDS